MSVLDDIALIQEKLENARAVIRTQHEHRLKLEQENETLRRERGEAIERANSAERTDKMHYDALKRQDDLICRLRKAQRRRIWALGICRIAGHKIQGPDFYRYCWVCNTPEEMLEEQETRLLGNTPEAMIGEKNERSTQSS